VHTERRAVEAKASSVQKSHLPVYDLLRREALAARLAALLFRRTRRNEARTSPWSEWEAFKTLLTPVKVALLAQDEHTVRERFPACNTNPDHDRTLVLSRFPAQ
jgi:hypothetical protein